MANSVAERWVRSTHQECLDHLLLLNQPHLKRVLTEYVTYYNARRLHQGLNQQTPMPLEPLQQGLVHRRDILGGILHDYYREAA
jgi:putative transposase